MTHGAPPRIPALILARICQARPVPLRRYDQLPATPATVLRRLAFLVKYRLATKRRLLFLGDDDFVSVLVARYLDPEEVSVLDIDQRVLRTLQRLARDRNATLHVHRYDVAYPLPGAFREQFDVCITDPPYTVAGFTTFLSRAMTCLRPGPDTHVIAALSPDDLSTSAWVECLDTARRLGLHRKQLLHDFNEYDLRARPWEQHARGTQFTSSLLWFERKRRKRNGLGERTIPDTDVLYDYES